MPPFLSLPSTPSVIHKFYCSKASASLAAMGVSIFLLTLFVMLLPILLHKAWKVCNRGWERLCRLEEQLLRMTGSEVGTHTQSRVFEKAVYEGILKIVRISDNKLGQTLQTQLRQREELQQLIQDMYTKFEESVCDASYFVHDVKEAADEFQQPIREFIARITQLEDRCEALTLRAEQLCGNIDHHIQQSKMASSHLRAVLQSEVLPVLNEIDRATKVLTAARGSK